MTLDEALAELHDLMHGPRRFHYAWAFGNACEGGKGHPTMVALRRRDAELRAIIAEHR